MSWEGSDALVWNAERLRVATDGAMRCLGFEDFADAADTGIEQMLLETLQQRSCGGGVVVHLQECIGEMTDEPWPHRTLVIGRIAIA